MSLSFRISVLASIKKTQINKRGGIVGGRRWRVGGEEKKNPLHNKVGEKRGSFLRGDILISFFPVHVVAGRLRKGQAGSVPQQRDRTGRVSITFLG